MSRWKAAGLHSLISIVIATLVGSLIYFVWYPPPYFQIAGGSKLMLLIMGVDVVVGPVLTLAVFKSGKKGLRFDLTVIALLQAVSFSYGASVIARARPVFVVGEVDRFVVVSANALDDKDLAEAKQSEFSTRSWTGPRLVGAMPPALNAQGYAVAMSALAGKDIDRMPKFYVPYDQVSKTLLAHSHPLADAMQKSSQAGELVQDFLRKHGGEVGAYRSLPLRGRFDSFTMVVSASTGQPIAALPIDPW
ncbi:MAG TPA: TfpX/TfpZ family type IV pilin accessory protein [Burkholderiales bacterium]|nr:TfpX/TfpZ family type IV pilin accessory protein [Burkholderiales bacterium]